MKLSTLSLLSFAHFLSSVLAAPTPADVSDLAPRNETVAKRAGGEINYLADCRRVDYDDNADYPASYMAWYSDIDWSNNYYHIPDALSSEYRDWANGGSYLHWEGVQHNIYFPASGITVQTRIESGAASRPHTAYAGWLQRTSDWQTFNCYRDNDRNLFIWYAADGVPDGSGRNIECKAKYWCVPNGKA